MKKLLTTITIIALFILSIQVQAQVKFGVKAGFNLSNVNPSFANPDNEPSTKLRLGYNVGTIVEYDLTDVISLQSGLSFTSKGFRNDIEELSTTSLTAEGYDIYIVNYLEIPLNVVYKINKFQFYTGPYLAFGFGGQNHFDFTLSNAAGSVTQEGELDLIPVFGKVKDGEIEEDEVAFSAFDLGLNFGIGYEVGPVLVNAGYSLGFLNVEPGIEEANYDPNDFRTTNRVISLSVSYFFIK